MDEESNSLAEPHEYGGIVDAISRRANERLHSRDNSTEALVAVIDALEADLSLSAQVGTALLKEREQLQSKVLGLERSSQQLLDRLGNSVRENVQLSRVSKLNFLNDQFLI